MNCKYDYYKEDEKYCPYLYCKIDDKRCIFSKKCLKVDKFIPMDGDVWKECPKYNMQMQNEIPSGANLIQTYREDKRGNLILYVVMNDKVEKVNTKLKSIDQNYVYIRDGLDGYEVSLVSFPERKRIVLEEIEEEPKEIKPERKKSYKKKVGTSDEKEKEYKSR